MFCETTINAHPYNWLIHHYSALAIKKAASHVKGMTLDIGCGIKPYRDLLAVKCEKYVGLEHPRTLHGLSAVDVAGDGLVLPFIDGCFDTAVSFQVLEHVPEPSQFLVEAFRVLKPGGKAILMTPFMWGEHEPPYDYYRYTQYGLRYLSDIAGF